MRKRQMKYFITCMMGMALFFSTPSYSFASVESNRNKVGTTSTYVDDEGNTKTIYWVDNMTPPKMGGADSEFIKKESTEANGVRYVEYVTPYTVGNGWYDVNKSPDQKLDAFLCYSASAANTLHWWFHQNDTYIEKYLEKYPDTPKANDIREMKNQIIMQQGSKIYGRFVQQFANRREGYWTDILMDQFINGYRPKANGGVNDPSFDGDDLIKNGPDERGGFFYNVFGINTLTERRYYDYLNNYQNISKDLKNFLSEGKIVTLTYDMGASAHVVTVWGAEYDMNGNLSGVYYSDSDDTDGYGMRRYRVMNKNGNAYVTTDTRDNGGGSFITSLSTLSSGKEVWEKILKEPQTELKLAWNHTELVYNGNAQKPDLKASNILDGDDVSLTVEGEGVEVGSYTATAKLSGTDASKYVLPLNHKKEFMIVKSDTMFEGGVKTYRKDSESSVYDKEDDIVVKVTPKAKTNPSLSPKYGKMSLYIGNQKLTEPVSIDHNGVYTMSYHASNGLLQMGSNTLTVKFHDDKNMKNHEEQVTITLKGEKYTSVPAVLPTCEIDGMKAHFIDSKGKFYIEVNGKKQEVSKQELVLPATGHRPGEWVQIDGHHYRECLNGCGIHLHEGACSGGIATETEPAICEICGHHYGDKLEESPIVPPVEPPVKPGDYDMISGEGGIHELSGNGSLTFKANGDFSKFVGIKVNGEVIDQKYYSAVSGSTIITLHPEFLNTLAIGTYHLEIDYIDGFVTCLFEVKAKADTSNQETNPSELTPVKPSENYHSVSHDYENTGVNTGDTSYLLMWVILMILSSMVLITVSKKTNMK